MLNRKVGRPSNKELQRRKYLNAFSFIFIFLLIVVIFYTIKGGVDSNKLKASLVQGRCKAGYVEVNNECFKVGNHPTPIKTCDKTFTLKTYDGVEACYSDDIYSTECDKYGKVKTLSNGQKICQSDYFYDCVDGEKWIYEINLCSNESYQLNTNNSKNTKKEEKFGIRNAQLKNITNKKIKIDLCSTNSLKITGATTNEIKAYYDRNKIKLKKNGSVNTRINIKPSGNIKPGDVVKITLVRLKDNSTVSVTFINKTNSCNIKALNKETNVSKASVEKVIDYEYTGLSIKPTPKLMLESEGIKKVLKNNIDISYSYLNNVKPGIATILIKGIGNYTGVKKVYFRIKESTIKLVDPNNYLTNNKCVSTKVAFNITDTSGSNITKVEYMNSNHGWMNIQNKNIECNKNSCTIGVSIKSKNLYYRITNANGKVVQYGPYNVCINTMRILDESVLKQNKCHKKQVLFTAEDILGNRITRVQYSEDNKKTWKTFSKITRSSDRTKETVKIVESHKKMYIKIKNIGGIEQIYGPYNICIKK